MIITNITDHAYQRASQRYKLDRDSLTRFALQTVATATRKGIDSRGNHKLVTITGLTLIVDTLTKTLVTVY